MVELTPGHERAAELLERAAARRARPLEVDDERDRRVVTLDRRRRRVDEQARLAAVADLEDVHRGAVER